MHVVDWQNVTGLTPSALALPGQGVAQLLAQFEGQRPIEVADAIRELPAKRRYEVVNALDDERLADILQELPESEQADLLEQLDTERAADVLEAMDPDDAADLLGELGASRGRAAAGPDGPRGLRAGAPAAQALPRHRGRPDDVRAGGAGPGHHRRRGAGPGARSRPDARAGVAGRSSCARRRRRPTGRYLGCVHLQRLLREPPAALVGGIVDTDLPSLQPRRPRWRR